MILNSVSPKGKACTVRVKPRAVIPLTISLHDLGFHSFKVSYEYRKFNTSKYLQCAIGLNHFVQALNRNAQTLWSLPKTSEDRRQILERLIDESLLYQSWMKTAGDHLDYHSDIQSYGGSR